MRRMSFPVWDSPGTFGAAFPGRKACFLSHKCPLLEFKDTLSHKIIGQQFPVSHRPLLHTDAARRAARMETRRPASRIERVPMANTRGDLIAAELSVRFPAV